MCQGITRFHPDCSHPKPFLIKEPCEAYKVDKCATYPTFNHNGITVHCGFCQIGINETILREYPGFPRRCPDCLTAEEDKIRGYNEAMFVNWEKTITELNAPDWRDGDEWKDEEWRQFTIGGYEMLIAQPCRLLSDDLEDLWDTSYGVGIEILEDTPRGRGVVAPLTPGEDLLPEVPPDTFVPVQSDVPGEGEDDVQEGEGESNEFNDTPFEFERAVVTPPASPPPPPPGPPPNTPCTPPPQVASKTPVASTLCAPAKTPLQAPIDAPRHGANDVLDKIVEEPSDAEDRPESSQITVIREGETNVLDESFEGTVNIKKDQVPSQTIGIRQEIRLEEELHEDCDDQDFSQATVIRHIEWIHKNEPNLKSFQLTAIRHEIKNQDESHRETRWSPPGVH